MHGFALSFEFEDFTIADWCDNGKWFDIKLLVDVCSGEKTKKMQSDSHSDRIQTVLESLGLTANKPLHLGRNLGAKTLDPLKEWKEEKCSMGQWSPDVRDSSRSSK